MRLLTKALFGLAAVPALALAAAFTPAVAEVTELRITKQPNIAFMPTLLMEHDKMIEKHAREAGLGDIKITWAQFSSGGAATDALLSGNVDFVNTGVTNMLLLWDRTKGDVKGLAMTAAVPSTLVTRNPNIKQLKDYGPTDKIALPTVKVAVQAITLGIGSEKILGADKWDALGQNTVTLGHPDAVAALLGGSTEVTSHFGAPPYTNIELKNPAIHVVMSGPEVMGGPAINAAIFCRTKFHDDNPKLMAAILAAYDEANKLIARDKKTAAQAYLAVTKERTTVDEMVEYMTDPNIVYSTTPLNSMKYADFMFRHGLLKEKPASWKDYFFTDIQGQPGS